VERRLKYQFDIEQAQVRATALKKVIAEYPEAAKRETSQVVDVRKDNEKFMSPMAQLVGAESEVISIRERMQKLDREIEQQNVMKEFVKDAESTIAEAHSGDDSVIKLSALISAFGKKVNTEAERERLSSLAADISTISARFLSQPRFIAEPYLPVRPERPSPRMMIVLMGAFAALLSAIFLWRKTIVRVMLGNKKD
jgi:hypothetical protein